MDLEEDVASITQQMEQLEQHTSQAISLVVSTPPCEEIFSSALASAPLQPCPCAIVPQELLGHCKGLYHANRQGIVHLEAHLKQYGYVPPAALQQPTDPLSGAQASRHPVSGTTHAA